MPIVKLHVHPDTLAPTLIYITGTSKSNAPFVEAKICGENAPNFTAAIYKTVRRQCTKLYGGNVPNNTAAMYETVRRSWTWEHPDKISWKMSKAQISPSG